MGAITTTTIMMMKLKKEAQDFLFDYRFWELVEIQWGSNSTWRIWLKLEPNHTLYNELMTT